MHKEKGKWWTNKHQEIEGMLKENLIDGPLESMTYERYSISIPKGRAFPENLITYAYARAKEGDYDIVLVAAEKDENHRKDIYAFYNWKPHLRKLVKKNEHRIKDNNNLSPQALITIIDHYTK